MKEEKKTVKNAFYNCKTPLEVFHRERSVRLNIAQELSRIGYFIEKDYRLVIQGDNKPEVKNLQPVIEERLQSFSPFDAYKIPDYFLPANMLHGLVTSEEWQKNGIEVLALDKQMIYPFYGVWSPTSQEYLNLVDLFMKSHRKPSDITNCVYLG